MFKLATLGAALFLPGWILAADYNIDREKSGRVGAIRISDFSITGGQVRDTHEDDFNKESTLTRERIFLNDPTCPVKIRSHTTEARRVRRSGNATFSGLTVIDIKSPTVAIDVRTSLYDVFGQHMKNLRNLVIQDFSPGQSEIGGAWRADADEIYELVTTVTWVARVRLADGTQWVYRADRLVSALSTLNLEQKLEDDGED